MCRKFLLVLSVLMVAALATASQAAPIDSFVNADFDDGPVTTPGPFTGFDTPVDIPGWTDYPTSPLNDAGVEGPGAWWNPYEINAGFMSSGDGAYTMSTYTIQEGDVYTISYYAMQWQWTGSGEWTATLFYDNPANVIGSYVQGGLPDNGTWLPFSDANGIAATPASVGGTLGILMTSTGTGIAQIDEITVVQESATSAYDPSPDDGADGVPLDVVLSWTPGVYADTHDIYLGTDEAKVTDANRDNQMGVLVKQDHDTNTYDPCGLELNQTYYWRIDEVNDAGPDPCLWPGEVWEFTTSITKAHDPSPPDGAPYVPFPDPNVWLRWTPGLYAAHVSGHKVYLDPNEQKVIDRSDCEVNGVSVTDPCYYMGVVGTDLDFNKTYFWAIDEVNAAGPDPCLWPGEVWSFTTEPNIPITDPNLLGWWKFDEGEGPLVLDWSGHRNHGTLLNDPCWTTEGVVDGALKFDGLDDHVSLPIGEDINSLTNSTYMVWVDFNSSAGGAWQRIFDFGNDVNEYMFLSPRVGDDGVMRFAISITSWNDEDVLDATQTLPSGWHHVAVTIDAGTGSPPYTLKLYLDGAEVGQITTGDVLPNDLGATTNNWLGRSQYAADAYFNGSLDDFRIYDYTLTEEEIGDKLNPLKAWKPNPAPGVTVTATPVFTLTWMPGRYADSENGHRVYFDPNEQKVIDRNGCEVNGVSTSDPCYPVGSYLEFSQTYFWAIDEVNSAGPDPCLWPGDVWSFTTSSNYVVEDFDSYASNEDLEDVWNEVGGAEISVETGITDANLVRDGNSMMYKYRFGTSQAYADITDLPSSIGSDWTANDVKALVLYFYGKPGNHADQPMYVALTDGDSSPHTGTVVYDGDANDVNEPEWHEWNIDLQDFVDNGDVNLANVARITIGFGGSSSDIYKSTVYFEDIGLYVSRCVPSLRKAAGDFDNDCDVDYDDIEAMTRHWLIGDYNADPLIAWYKLDDGSGATATDSSAYGNHGTLVGNPQWVGGHIGGALDLNGVNDYVDCGNDVSLDITSAVTLAAWVDTNDSNNGEFNPYVAKGDHSYGLQHSWSNGIEFFIWDDDDGTWYSAFYAIDGSFNDEWHHLAGTYDGGQLKLYIDGVLQVTTDHIGTMGIRTFPVEIGRSSEYTDRLYNGLIDDVRIYDKALSQAEIASIMDGTLGSVSHYHPVPSPAELYKAEAQGSRSINLRDFAAVVAEGWLGQQLWP